MGRIDAYDKAVGRTVYAGDVVLPGMCHAALVRSPLPHARIVGIDTSEAEAMPGVIGVFTAEDMPPVLYGRRVRDIPILARDEVMYVGQRVAAVVAETREQAEAAALMVFVDYEELPAVLDAEEAVAESSLLVHEAPWAFDGAVVKPTEGRNLQSVVRLGDEQDVEEALGASAHVIERTYTTPTGHQGYLEPQATLVHIEDGEVHIWVSDKNPYRLREEVAHTSGFDISEIVLHPVAIGGDFGGKGSYGEVPLCVELARRVGRPVRLALRYSEDLISNAARHPSKIRIRIGCDAEGRLTGLHCDVLSDGGACAGYKPRERVDLHGFEEAGSAYRFAAMYLRSRIAYTHSLPRGHMRSPGEPEAVFAVESAIDELAAVVGMSPVELRRRNLLRTGDADALGRRYVEMRSIETLDAALSAAGDPSPGPEEWLTGTGLAIFHRATISTARTSLTLTQLDDGSYELGVPVPETGTGSHTFVRQALAERLGVPAESISVEQMPTDALPFDRGAGASRVSVALMMGIDRLLATWSERGDAKSVTVDVAEELTDHVTSFCTQIAHVAVDPGSGQVKVLEIVTAADVADVINPTAHRMQLEGGIVMGFGFACLEDLELKDGQVWAGNLGEFRIPSVQDTPRLRTVLVPGGKGVGPLNIKSVGELGNVAVAAAIANAIADAARVRVRDLPIRAENVWRLFVAADTSSSNHRKAM